MQSKVGWLYRSASKGVLGSPFQPESHSEPFLFRKPGHALEVASLSLAQPYLALRCGLFRAGQDSLGLP